MKVLCAFLLIIIQGIGCLGQIKIEKRITPIFRIGDNEDLDKEYLFWDIRHFILDKQNNFYLVDKAKNTIDKYSSDGKFIKTIGNTGRGPGEYKEIYKMLINDKNILCVIDRLGQKIIKYNLNGVFLEEVKFHRGTEMIFLDLPNEKYIMHNLNVLNDNNCFVVYDGKYENEIITFGNSDLLIDKDNPILYSRYNSNNYFDGIKIDSNKFVLSNIFYGRKLLLCEFIENNLNIKKLNSIDDNKLPYQMIEPDEINGPYLAMVFSGRSKHQIKFDTYTLGAFLYREKFIINIYLNKEKRKGYKLHFDLFNKDGDFLSTLNFSDELEYNEGFKPLGFDQEGNFYHQSTREDYNILCKTKIELKK